MQCRPVNRLVPELWGFCFGNQTTLDVADSANMVECCRFQ